jgi:N-methylhydantoinase A/oxoprolinase/acetone carboxylase beta subunit
LNSARLGIDVGGTFTDLVLLEDQTGQILTEKVLTTPANPSAAILHGVDSLTAAGMDLAQVRTIIHGTTLVPNAIIERKGVRTGLITTKGFRDILQFVGRELRYDTYDPNITYPKPIVPRTLRREVPERVSGGGEVLTPLDTGRARDEIAFLLDAGVEAIAVTFLHSFLYPGHELKVRELIREQRPDLPISLSHEVLPQIREYERTSATVMNAYVQPLMRRYLSHLEKGLKERGFRGEFFLMTSSGGSIDRETAEEFPIQLIESGPAAGALVAGFIGTRSGEPNVLSFDMGGTTAKAAIIRRGRALVNTTHEVARVRRFKRGSGLPVGIPVLDLIEIGAGGGSIAEIDEVGLLQVGPRSAGADPGPACYGRGGTEPTVTDANVILGFINPDYFLGGAMQLDRAAAVRALETEVVERLGLDAVGSAAAIYRIVTENMAEAARVHSVEMNVDIRRYGVIAFGGAGPLHAYGVARRLGSPFVMCPRDAGVLSALGLLVAPLAFEFARTMIEDLDRLNPAQVRAIFSELEQEGRAMLSKSGVTQATFEHSVDMSYVGQGFEVTTTVPPELLQNGSLSTLKKRFDDTYAERFGRRLDDLEARAVTWRVLASGPVPEVVLSEPTARGNGSEALKGYRPVHFPEFGQIDKCAVYSRLDLALGAQFNGPAVAEEKASTVVIPPDARARVDEQGNIIFSLGAN